MIRRFLMTFALVALPGLALAQSGVSSISTTRTISGSTPTSGCVAGGVLRSISNLIDCGANLTYSSASGPRLTVGSGSTTSAGLTLGYLGTSGIGGIWSTGVTPSTANYALSASATAVTIGGGTGAASGIIYFAPSGGAARGYFDGTAGAGLGITAGTATTSVSPLSTTQTWNNAAITFPGHTYTITDTASASGSLHSQWLGGAAGATALMSLNKSGTLTLNGGGTFSSTISTALNQIISWASATKLSSSADGNLYMSNNGQTKINYFDMEATGTIQMGLDVNGAAVDQTFKAHDGITGTDISGANLTIAAGRGTGAGAGGTVVIQTAPVGSTGTTAQTLATVATFAKSGGIQLATGTKPACASGIRGTIYYVAGGAGVADTMEVCCKDNLDVYAWVSIF